MAPVLKTGRAQALVGSNPTPSANQFSIDPWNRCVTKYATPSPIKAAPTTSDKWCAATYILENAMSSGIARNPRPIRQLANASVAKNAGDAAVWPVGNAV